MLHHVSLEERPIVVLGFRGGLLGANPIPHRLARGMQFGTGRAVWHDHVVWHEPEQFISELNNISLELYTVQSRKTSKEYTNYLLSAWDIYMGRGTTEGRKQYRNKSKSWKIGQIKVKEVNQAARDSDDALVCCVENTVEDRIMDSGASFHATYCKEEFERFKLRSSKVRLKDNKTLDIASVRDVILKTSFGTSWTLKDVRYIPSLKRRLISVGQLDEEGYHVGFGDQQWKVTKGSLVVAHGNKRGSLYMVEVHPEGIGAIINGSGSAAVEDKELQRLKQVHTESSGLHLLHQSEDPATMILLSKTALGVANGIVMLKMVLETPLQFGVAERLSRTFRAKSTGICVEAPKMLWADSNPGGSSDTSEGSENSGSFEDSRRSDEEYSEDGASSNEGGSETPQNGEPDSYSKVLSSKESVQWKKAIIKEIVSLKMNGACSLVRLSAGKNASQSLWMFMVKEEQCGKLEGGVE
ncbi:retrovirus-related pol polyprotein from transposon TNT 1-94 [Tanacetum coccineum]